MTVFRRPRAKRAGARRATAVSCLLFPFLRVLQVLEFLFGRELDAAAFLGAGADGEVEVHRELAEQGVERPGGDLLVAFGLGPQDRGVAPVGRAADLDTGELLF